MRYVTEFTISVDEVELSKNLESRIGYEKRNGAFRIGEMIGERVGYEEVPYHTLRYRMGIEAFAEKDWLDFKQEIKQHIINSFPIGRADYELIQFGSMIARLEKIGLNRHNSEPATAVSTPTIPDSDSRV